MKNPQSEVEFLVADSISHIKIKKQNFLQKIRELYRSNIYENSSYFNPLQLDKIADNEIESIINYLKFNDNSIALRQGEHSANIGLSVKCLMSFFNLTITEFSTSQDPANRILTTSLISQYFMEYIQAFLAKRESLISEQKDKIYGALLETLKDQQDKMADLKRRFFQGKIDLLGKIVGSIASDFDILITSVMGSLSLAGSSACPEAELKIHLKEAERRCLKARLLTSQLNTVFIKDKLIFEFSWIDEILNATIQLLNVPEKYKINIDIEPGLPAVKIDRNKIILVIYNLLRNSIEAMPKGGEICLFCVLIKDGKNISLRIQDNGTIPGEINIKKCFTPFFTTKKNHRGLGLSLCQSIIDQHAGKIIMEYKEGKGIIVEIKLPINYPEDT